MKEYVVVDLETTGLSRYRHKITEVAAVKVRRGKIVEKFQALVNPKTHIPRFITKLTGITNDMVKNAPVVEKVLPPFFDFIGDNVMIAHNATFDYGFIHHNAQRHLDVEFANERLCTRKLANRLIPELPSKKLSCICGHFDITNAQAHRAMADVHATTEVFSRFLSLMEDRGISGREQVMKFERSKR